MRLAIYLPLFIFLIGCSATMPTIYIPFAPQSNEEIMRSIVLVVHEHDFSPTLVDTATGLLVTDWRSITTKREETTNIILSGHSYKERMKLTIAIDRQNSQVVLKPLKQYHANEYGWLDSTMRDRDVHLLNQIAREIANKTSGVPYDIRYIQPVE